MNKAEYKELLKRPEWKNKRIQILKRDSFSCRRCGRKTGLQVHHKYYREEKLPWQYPNSALLTLCSVCHKKEHAGKNIGQYFKQPKKYLAKRKIRSTGKKKKK